MSEKIKQPNILVVGATGIAGSAFLKHCLGQQALAESVSQTTNQSGDGENLSVGQHTAPANWQFTGLTRNSRMQSQHERLNCVHVDLLGDCEAITALQDITHLVFAGYVPEKDPALQLDRNTALLENCLRALKQCPLQQVVLLQGMKYYGSHKGCFQTPAREDDSRLDEPHYYYAQQDIVEASGIDWTCLRPHVICGTDSIGTPQNILGVIGCYLSLMKAEGQPLRWPGSETSYHALNQATDANLLAQAIVWALQSPAASGESFNVTNGDFFRWQHLWPRIAQQFNMPTAEPAPQQLQQSMQGMSDAWEKLVQSHQLRSYALDDICDWTFADYILKTEWDVMASTIKIREAGFHACMDTETMYLRLLNELQAARVIP